MEEVEEKQIDVVLTVDLLYKLRKELMELRQMLPRYDNALERRDLLHESEMLNRIIKGGNKFLNTRIDDVKNKKCNIKAFNDAVLDEANEVSD